MAEVNWGERAANYIMETEGFRGEVYDDAGEPAIGYGHRVLDGEDFSAGISEMDGRRLLLSDWQRKERESRAHFGGDKWDGMPQLDQAKFVAGVAWNPGIRGAPKFAAHIGNDDIQGQLDEYKLNRSDGTPMDIRNDRFYNTFFADDPRLQKVTMRKDDGPAEVLEPVRHPDVEADSGGLKSYVESDEFLLMNAQDRVNALAERDERFAQMLRQDPEKAGQFAKAAAQFAATGGYDPSMWEAFQGGLERGVGLAALPIVGAMRLLEDSGVIETDKDDDLLDWANQRMIDGETRIGTDWENKVAGVVGSFGTAVIPAAIATASLSAGGAAVGLAGVPLWVLAEGGALAANDYLTGYAQGGTEEANKRGSVGLALGMAGGASSALPRRVRMPLDFVAALGAGAALDMPWEENFIQALSVTALAGAPGARVSPKKALAIGVEPDVVPGAHAILKEAENDQIARQAVIAELNTPLKEPIKSRDGVEYTTLGEYLKGEGEAIGDTPVIHWAPQERTAAQNAKHKLREELAQDDMRPIIERSDGSLDAEIPKGWNPGWRHVDQVQHGATPDRVMVDSGGALKPAAQTMNDFATAFEFTVERGNIRSGNEPRGEIGWHWAKDREMKVLRRDDVQTFAHEWGHDIVVLDQGLARYVQGAEHTKDVRDLRSWVAQKEAEAGNVMTEPGIPSALVHKYQKDIPDRFKYMEELMALSYDRPDLREGFSELMRVYLTNNEKYGGATKLDGPDGIAPIMTKVIDDWVAALPKAKKEALETFAKDSTAYAQQDAISTILSTTGGDFNSTSLLQGKWSKFRQQLVDQNEGVRNMIAKITDANTADHVIAYFQSANAASRLSSLSMQSNPVRLVRNADGFMEQRVGTGKNLQSIVNDIGASHEMQGAASAYFNSRRSQELYGQAIVAGKTVDVNSRVDLYVQNVAKEIRKNSDAGRTSDPQNVKLVKEWRKAKTDGKLRDEIENAILARLGAKRREQDLTRVQIAEGMKLPDNPRYAHLPKAFRDLQKWWGEVRDYGRDAGNFSQKQIDDWGVENSQYAYPFARDMSDQEFLGMNPSAGNAVGGVSTKRLTGSGGRHLKDDWLTLAMEGADNMYRRAEANLAKQVMIDTALADPTNAGVWFAGLHEAFVTSKNKAAPFNVRVGDIDKPKGHSGKGDSVITVMRDGKPHYYDIKDHGTLQSVQFLSPPAMNGIVKILNKVRTFKQDLVTLNPDFFLPALIRDLPAAFIFGKAEGSVFKKAAVGMKHAFLNSPEYQEYIALVGSASALTNVKPATKARLLATARKADPRIRDVLTVPGEVVNVLRRVTNSIEASTRFGEYQAARKNGVPAKHAAWLGTQIQPNFQAQGTNMFLRGLMKTIPFADATKNSVDRLARGVFMDAEGRGRVITRLAAMATAGVVLEEINRRLIDNYHEVPAWLKQAYHLIPVPKLNEGGGLQYDKEGKLEFDIYSLAKNHESGLLTNLASRTLDQMYSSSRKDMGRTAFDLTALLLGGVGVNAAGKSWPLPAPVLIQEAVEIGINRNTFTGNPIENMELAARAAYSRVDARTPEVYKMWGRAAQKMQWLPDQIESPKMLQHIVESITSTWGTQAAFISEGIINPEGPAQHIESYPILRRFMVQDEKYSTVANDYFDTLNELMQLKRTMDWHSDNFDMDTVKEAYTNPETMKALMAEGAYSDTRKSVAELEEMKELVRDSNLDSAEKTRRMDRMTLQQRALQRRVMQQWGRPLQ